MTSLLTFLLSGGIYSDRFRSVAATELSLSTEGYNTAYSVTPDRNLPTPPPTSWRRAQVSDEKYEELNAIKEEEYEDEDVGKHH